MDRLLGMEIFVQAAERGSFSAAAQALKVSPGLVTKHIKSLEDHFGVDLFYRTTRRITLTEAGAILRARWQKILSDIGDAEAAVGCERLKVRGTLRISTPAAFGRLKIAPLVAEFAKLHPDLVVELLFNNNRFDPIAEGIDVAFRMSALSDQDAPNLVVRRIGTYGTIVCGAPSYLARHGRPMAVHDLTQHNCLGHRNEASAGINPWRFRGPAGTLAVAVRGSYLSNNTDALIAAAVQGNGLICLPRLMVGEEIAAEQLVPLILDYNPVEQAAYATWAASRNVSARIRKFIDFAVVHLAVARPSS
jgi:DNA-binding transcriptional LysR family regulator